MTPNRVKKIVLIVVAVYEIVLGLDGFVSVSGWVAGVSPYYRVPALWFGVFPIMSLIAGVMLLLQTKYSLGLTRILLALQIPCIVASGIPLLRVADGFNLYVTAIWLGRNGAGPTILGLNFLAIGMLVLLLWAKPLFQVDDDPEDQFQPPEPPRDLNLA